MNVYTILMGIVGILLLPIFILICIYIIPAVFCVFVDTIVGICMIFVSIICIALGLITALAAIACHILHEGWARLR